MKPIDYMQTDRRWASRRYAAKGENTTIKSAGCGITCAAMVIASLRDPSVTPIDTARWSMQHGYKAYRQGTYYSYFIPQFANYDISCTQMNSQSIYHGKGLARAVRMSALEAVKKGDWIICCMGRGDWTSSGHFILWYGLDSAGNALLLDPNSTRRSRRCASVSKLIYQTKYLWKIETEADMTKEEVKKIIEEWFTERGLEEPAEWSKEARDFCYEKGIITSGAYRRPATREELAQAIYAYDKEVK